MVEQLTLNQFVASSNLASPTIIKKIWRWRLKFIYGEFEEDLKKFSRSEGKILIRLVHRQTGKTTFDLVKELRAGWKAFWYQTTASLFKLSLKDTFNVKLKFIIKNVGELYSITANGFIVPKSHSSKEYNALMQQYVPWLIRYKRY